MKISLEIYKTIIASTGRYANSRILEEEWAEVYGLLYGYNDKDDVIITEAIPFTHTKKKGHILRVEFDDEDYALAADIETSFFDRNPPQFIVGWFHSHPGLRIMLSQDDVKTQLAWQSNNPLAIAIVFNMVRLAKQIEMPYKKGDPVTILKEDPGFECFRLDDPERGIEANYHQVPFEFIDVKRDSELIKNAQEFQNWVTKAFPKDDKVLTEYKTYIESTITKLNQLYQGTESYLQTLIRKNESSRITEVLDRQLNDAEKILEQGNSMISIFRMMMPYLEYKEREKLVPQIETILKIWDDKAATFLNDMRALPTKIKNQPS